MSAMANNALPEPANTIPVLYGFMACFQIILMLEFVIDPQGMISSSAFFKLIEDQRSGILLLQLFGCAILFVDAVLRFDFIKKKWFHLAGIGLFICHWMFQMFVHFLSSSYLT